MVNTWGQYASATTTFHLVCASYNLAWPESVSLVCWRLFDRPNYKFLTNYKYKDLSLINLHSPPIARK